MWLLEERKIKKIINMLWALEKRFNMTTIMTWSVNGKRYILSNFICLCWAGLVLYILCFRHFFLDNVILVNRVTKWIDIMMDLPSSWTWTFNYDPLKSLPRNFMSVPKPKFKPLVRSTAKWTIYILFCFLQCSELYP